MYSQSYSDSESLDGSSLFLILWGNISLYLLASSFIFIFDIYEYVFINCDDTPRFEVFFCGAVSRMIYLHSASDFVKFLVGF